MSGIDTGKAAVIAYTNLNFDQPTDAIPSNHLTPSGNFAGNWRLSPQTRNNQ